MTQCPECGGYHVYEFDPDDYYCGDCDFMWSDDEEDYSEPTTCPNCGANEQHIELGDVAYYCHACGYSWPDAEDGYRDYNYDPQEEKTDDN